MSRKGIIMAADYNIFENRDGAIFTNYDVEFILFNDNVTDIGDMRYDVFLFGSVIIVHDGGKLVEKTCILATRVIMPLYSEEQISKEDPYTIISFKKGDKIIESEMVQMKLDNLKELFGGLLNGNLPPNIKYTDYYPIIINCMEFNFNLAFPRVLLEVLIAELFLDSTGTKPARLSNIDEMGTPVSITNLVLSKNTFNSMTFRDPSKSILINKGKTDAQQLQDPSPLEKYMRM